MSHCFDFSFSFHGFCSGLELFGVDEFLWPMHSSVSGAFSVHVKLHSRVHVFGVACIETAVFAENDIHIV